MSFFAALMTLIAFAIDIALYAYVKNRMATLNDVDASTTAGHGEGSGYHARIETNICLPRILAYLCFVDTASSSWLYSVLRSPWGLKHHSIVPHEVRLFLPVLKKLVRLKIPLRHSHSLCSKQLRQG